MTSNDAWRELAGNRGLIRDRTVQDVLRNLRARPDGPRNQATDDEILSPLADTTALAIGVGDVALAREVFRRTLPLLREHEQRNTSEIHKGAAFFNVGVAHLTSFDFIAAMQFFEMAQEETRLTTGSEDYSVYEDELFERNFWDAVDQELAERPLRFYPKLWGRQLDMKQVVADWCSLSNDTKLGCILCWGAWIRIARLEGMTGADHTLSLGYARWGLVSDLTILLETEIRRHSSVDGTLGKMLFQGFRCTQFGDLSRRAEELHERHVVRDQEAFEETLPVLLSNIESAVSTTDALATALYLLYICRNQVNHRIDFGMTYHADPGISHDAVQTLFSLLGVSEWAK